MPKLTIEVPEDVEEDIKKFPETDWSSLVADFVRMKSFELEVSRSRRLRQLLFKSLVSESKLTEEEALKLGEKVNKGMLKSLKEEGWL